MARKKTIAVPRAKATTEGLQLPLNTPAIAQAPAKSACQPLETTAAVKTAVRKTAAKPSKRPGKTASGRTSPIAVNVQGQEMIASLERLSVLAAKGAENLGKEVVGLAQGSLQAQLILTKALIDAKTPQEALTLQGNFVRESLGNMTQGVTRLTGMSVDLTQAILAPIHGRMRTTLT